MPSYHCSVKTGGKGRAGKHADYITRDGKYAPELTKGTSKLEDLEHTASGNMPRWAEHAPGIFWRAADEHERANGATYREIEVALPRELNPEQRRALVDDFVRQQIGDRHPYTYAIHVPRAAIEKGEQPHAHIMYSERALDGIARDPELFFKRANTKTPEKGGCKKDSAGTKERLLATRERWADVQNKHLEKAGFDVRVSHLSLRAQGIERTPEMHLGPVLSRQHAPALREYRAAERELAQTPKVDAAAQLQQAEQQAREAARREAEINSKLTAEKYKIEKIEAGKKSEEEKQLIDTGLLTQKEKDLAARIHEALKKDNYQELDSCLMQVGILKRDALKDLADVLPQPVNRIAIEHKIKQDQNETARKRRSICEPWEFVGPRKDQCIWDFAAREAKLELEAHVKTDRPTGFFKRSEAKEWDAETDKLSRRAADLAEASELLKCKLRTETATLVAQAEAVEAQRAAKKAPERALHENRIDTLACLSKALETALEPHRERERQRAHGSSRDFGR